MVNTGDKASSKLPVEDVEVTAEEEVRSGESKSEAFQRISSGRINRVVDDMRILTKTSDTSRYDYTAADVERMFNYIQTALEKSKGEFMRQINADPFMPAFKWSE